MIGYLLQLRIIYCRRVNHHIKLLLSLHDGCEGTLCLALLRDIIRQMPLDHMRAYPFQQRIQMKKLGLIFAMTSLTACTAIQLLPQAAHIIATPNVPSESCHYVGQVVGSQGNLFTGSWTSKQNLEIGAMNDIRNQASKMGANYVQIINSYGGEADINPQKDESRRFIKSTSTTHATLIGNAYRCPLSRLNMIDFHS